MHDYHLIPLGRRLRELGVHQPIGFFLHIPFPNIEVLRVLPVYGELLRDLTSYDVVGFPDRTICDASTRRDRTCGDRKRCASDGRTASATRTMRADVYPDRHRRRAIQAADAVDSQAEP